jgi:SAM-dependent methyltransferase
MPSSPPKPAAASAATAAAVAPSAFDSLAARYNFLTEQSFGSTFADLVVDEGRRRGGACRVLDIGCGSGIGRNVALQWAIKEIASDFWGIEPDRDVTVAGGLFDHFEHALMETAELPAGQFDLAYSAMVMEHVADPAPFFQALHRVLKPGGAYVFVTPNARSFVPWATKTLHALKVDEIALRMLRGRQVEEYHYPVKFLCNSPAQLDRLARQHGFDAPQYAYSEGQGSHSYLRGPLAPLRPVLVAKRRLLRNPERLATMFCRMTKAG